MNSRTVTRAASQLASCALDLADVSKLILQIFQLLGFLNGGYSLPIGRGESQARHEKKNHVILPPSADTTHVGLIGETVISD